MLLVRLDTTDTEALVITRGGKVRQIFCLDNLDSGEKIGKPFCRGSDSTLNARLGLFILDIV
jgi:hypothetical protein